MDIVLLILLAFSFVGLISILKINLMWSIFIIIILALIYISIKHPHGRKDWEHDLRTSIYFVVTAVLLILMLYVMYLASGSIMMPPLITVVIWASWVIIAILALLSIFFPEGYHSSLRISTFK